MSIYTNSYITKIQEISTPNKYTKWYCQIVARAQERAVTRKEAKAITGECIELHHIIPRSFNIGGKKDKENYAYLTIFEHFVCHHLLTKMVVNKKWHNKMNYAFLLMLNTHIDNKRCKVTSRLYALVKSTGPWNKGITGTKLGPQTPEHIAKRTSSRIGVTSPLKGVARPPRPAEWSAKISFSNKGKISPNRGKSSPLKGKDTWNKGITGYKIVPREKVTCPYCLKNGDISPMKRHHFDNCKLSPHFKVKPPKKYKEQTTTICPHCNKTGGIANMKRYHFDNCKQK